MLVVDDSAVVRQAMQSILGAAGMEVAVAADPLIAMSKMAQVRPDVMVLDLEMPRMDGLSFLHRLMAEDPLPVVICSGQAAAGTGTALRAMSEGAVAIVSKPRLGVRGFLEESAVMLEETVRGAAGARVRGRAPIGRRGVETVTAVVPRTSLARPLAPATDTVVAIGASTGGTEAIQEILEAMPAGCPGLVVVQHMPEGFTRAFADRLDQVCPIAVKEASHGDAVLPGRALVAPGNRHTLLVRSGAGYVVHVQDGPLVSRHRPSVDVLFSSAALAAGPRAVGVILTGMGADGAQGLLEMKRAGAATIAQDEETCVVFGMPKEAIARAAVDEVAPLARIPARILAQAAERARPAGPTRPSGS